MVFIRLNFQDEQDELVHQVLGTGTVLMKEFSKLVADDPDKLSLDLNSVYKKYEVAAKADQARSYLQSQVKFNKIVYISVWIFE